MAYLELQRKEREEANKKSERGTSEDGEIDSGPMGMEMGREGERGTRRTWGRE